MTMKETPRALFFNVPGHGHVNPSLPLVHELSHRGHRITYFITAGFRPQVEAAGAAFAPYRMLGDDYFSGSGMDGSRPHTVAVELLKLTEKMLPDLLARSRAAAPDYVLYDGMCPWGYWVARILGVPAVASLALLPPFRPPPQALFDTSMLRFIFPTLFRGFSKIREAGRLSRALGRRYGVPPLDLLTFLSAPADLSIAYTSRAFQPYAAHVDPCVRFVGRFLDEGTDAHPALFEPAAGRPIVYISLGTVINTNRDLMAQLLGAFVGRSEYVLLTTGKRFSAEDFGELPENISVHPWLPQAAVLKRAALFITHGGLNSVHDGFLCGVPMLLCPQQDEQRFNSERVVELGAGLLLPRNGGGVQELAALLLEEDRFAESAARIGRTLREAGGMEKAADEIEALLAAAGRNE